VKIISLRTWFKYTLLQIPLIPSSLIKRISGDFQSYLIAPYTIMLTLSLLYIN
jgi:hypothetical protein